MDKLFYLFMVILWGLFLFSLGGMIGEKYAIKQFRNPIQMDQCVAVCAEEFEKWGC